MAQQNKLDLGEEKKNNASHGVLFIVLGAVLATLLVVFAVLYFLGIFPPLQRRSPTALDELEAGVLPTIYFSMDPPFVVNFKSNPEARLLQIGFSVASKHPSVIDTVKKHSPMIRNNVLLLLSGQDPAILKTAKGKEALRAKLLEEINAVVLKQTGYKEGAEEVFFTAFIMQ